MSGSSLPLLEESLLTSSKASSAGLCSTSSLHPLQNGRGWPLHSRSLLEGFEIAVQAGVVWVPNGNRSSSFCSHIVREIRRFCRRKQRAREVLCESTMPLRFSVFRMLVCGGASDLSGTIEHIHCTMSAGWLDGSIVAPLSSWAAAAPARNKPVFELFWNSYSTTGNGTSSVALLTSEEHVTLTREY
jgi:hypothetical protein